MPSYAIKKDGELVRQVIYQPISKTWKTTQEIETLLFESKKTAAEVSMVLGGEVVEFNG